MLRTSKRNPQAHIIFCSHLSRPTPHAGALWSKFASAAAADGGEGIDVDAGGGGGSGAITPASVAAALVAMSTDGGETVQWHDWQAAFGETWTAPVGAVAVTDGNFEDGWEDSLDGTDGGGALNGIAGAVEVGVAVAASADPDPAASPDADPAAAAWAATAPAAPEVDGESGLTQTSSGLFL